MVDIAKSLGIGTYTTKSGKVISHADLPKEVQDEIEGLGVRRDNFKHLSDAGIKDSWGGGNTADNLKQKQHEINELYDPDTREAAMARRTGERIVRELSDRLDQRDRKKR